MTRRKVAHSRNYLDHRGVRLDRPVPQAKNLIVCDQCGMPHFPGEFHPFTACLLFITLRDPELVRMHIDPIVEFGRTT